MNNFLFDKTDKGREEIATRKYGVAPRMRSLLILVDGQKTTPELLAKIAGLNLDMDSLVALTDGGFIAALVPDPLPQAAPEPVPTRPPAMARARAKARLGVAGPNSVLSSVLNTAYYDGPATEILPASIEESGEAELSPIPVASVLAAPVSIAAPAYNAQRIGAAEALALQKFFNETIKSTLGLRGFTMQLKVERATTLDEFRALRMPYLLAVQKAKGDEMERSLRDRLDQLLGQAEQSAV